MTVPAEHTGADRLPPLSESDLSSSQRAAVEQIVAGPRGALVGPFVPLLRSPGLMSRLQAVGEYLRFDSWLADDLVELVILVVAREWNQQFEWAYHHPIALQKGVPADVIESVATGARPTTGRAELAVVWDLVTELVATREVSDPVYATALAALDEQGVIEVVGTVGYYTTLAMTMNLARTPAPEDGPRLEPPPSSTS